MEADGSIFVEILSIECIIASAVLEKEERRYEVKWNQAWVLETQLPDGVLETYQKNEETRYDSCEGRFYITDDKVVKDGQRSFLLCRENTWEHENLLNKIDKSIIRTFWSQSLEKITVKEEEDLGDYEPNFSSGNAVIPLIKCEDSADQDKAGYHCDMCKRWISSEHDAEADEAERRWKCQGCYKTLCTFCSENMYEDENASYQFCEACCEALGDRTFKFCDNSASNTVMIKNHKDEINFPFYFRPAIHSSPSLQGVSNQKEERKKMITGIKVLSGRHKDYVNPRNKTKTENLDQGSQICDINNLFCKKRGRPIGENDPTPLSKDDTDGPESETDSVSLGADLPGQFKCRFCNVTFNRQFTLNTHMRIHTGAKPYECHICGAHFRQSGTRSTHIRAVHLKERPFECEVCGKTFSHKSSITVHLRTHTKEKPYQCLICERRFTDRATYLKHQAVHTGIKPYVCGECGQRFTQKSNLKRHFKTKHMSLEFIDEVAATTKEEEPLRDVSATCVSENDNNCGKDSAENNSNSNNVSISNENNSKEDVGKDDKQGEERPKTNKENTNNTIIRGSSLKYDTDSNATFDNEKPEVTDDILENDALYFSFETPVAVNDSAVLNGSDIFNDSSDDLLPEDKGKSQNKNYYIRFPWQRSKKTSALGHEHQ